MYVHKMLHRHMTFLCGHIFLMQSRDTYITWSIVSKACICFLLTHLPGWKEKWLFLVLEHYFKMCQLTQHDICRISLAEWDFVIYNSAADFIAHLNQLKQMNSSPVGQCYDYAFSKGLMCFNCTYISRLLFCSFANNRHGMICGVLGMRLVCMRRLWCSLMHMQELTSYL